MSNQISLHNVTQVEVVANEKLSTETYTRDIIITQRVPIFDRKANDAGIDYIENEFSITLFGDKQEQIKVSV